MKLIRIGSDRYDERDSVRESIIDVLGDDFWTLLIERLGGLDVEVPKKMTSLHPGHELVLALGMEDASRLVELFRGERISIPKPATASSLDLCLAALKEGLTNREIARKIGMTERGVRKVFQCAGLRNPNRAGGRVPVDMENGKSAASSPASAAGKLATGLPRVFNGGLTGLGGISGTLPHPNNENRSTGL